MRKPNYNKKSRKRKTQKELIGDTNQPHFAGFAGSTPGGYLKQIGSHNYKTVTLFENDYDVYKIAVKKCKKYSNVIVKFSDISKCLRRKRTHYDFDFKTTIRNPNVSNMLGKICKLDSFSMTYCLRGMSVINTNEKVAQHILLTELDSMVYRDPKGPPMMTYVKKQTL